MSTELNKSSSEWIRVIQNWSMPGEYLPGMVDT